MCTDRRGQLCACEYRRLKKKKNYAYTNYIDDGYLLILVLFLQDCLQRTRRASRNIVRSAFHSSGPLLKSDEGKILFYFNIVCLFCFVLFAFATPLSSQNRYFTITDLNCLLRLQYLLKSNVKNILKQPRNKPSCFKLWDHAVKDFLAETHA